MRLLGFGLAVSATGAAASRDLWANDEAAVAKVHPGVIEFSELTDASAFPDSDAREILAGELHRTGIVQIAGIPGFAALREKVLTSATPCSRVSEAARKAKFSDGSERVTLANELVEGARENVRIDHGSASDVAACVEFDASSSALRSLVTRVSEIFASRLSETFVAAKSLMATPDGQREYTSFADVTQMGHQLEHFHSYRFEPTKAEAKPEEATVDFHTDQGLFIAFTPPMMVSRETGRRVDAKPGRFFIELRSGKEAEVVFVESGDALVIMLGDGVNQYVNNNLKPHTPELRATPHAFTMPRGVRTETEPETGAWRSWYGRMFLPPSDALNKIAGRTFGEMRDRSVGKVGDAADAEEALAMGCSGTQHARELQMKDCASNQLYCWHRCFNFTDEISPEACAAKNLGFQCASQYNQVWPPTGPHGDYNPMCTNATDLITPAPTIPRADEGCPSISSVIERETYQGWRALSASTYVLWNITSDGFLEGKMIYDGLVGWLAFGLAKEGGAKKGMHGAKIIMGIVNFGGGFGEVDEYEIHPSLTAFRHWQTPVAASIAESDFVIDGACFSSMSFKTKSSAGENFNLTGPNNLIWAVHDSTWLKDYHGGGDKRGVLSLDFRDFTPPGEEEEDSAAAGLSASGVLAILAAAVMLAL